MKTLYESILDDEDVLMSDIKKGAKNPFYLLKIKYDEARTINDWKRAAEKIMSEIQLPTGSGYYIGHNYINISMESRHVLEISFRDDHPMFPKDACCLLFDWTKEATAVKFKSSQIKFVEGFIKAYNFKYIKAAPTRPQNLYYLNK
jgi:hypothetical protein